MSRALRTIKSQIDRAQLTRWMEIAPWGTRVELKAPKRSVPQSDKMWASLTDIAQQPTYHGLRLSPDDWKLLFLDALKREVRMVPNLDGNGFVSLGRSSSDLSKSEMSDLLEVIMAWGARHGVIFQESREMAA
jgi:hypothetical protein